ncbi:dipeptide transport system permease protein DppB [Rhodococcus wratislaviensis]|uniref:Dipeptide transport system permease protein DppB n=1 Tax=Rhodococcus wratislaviensis TaxID=44752 RepID=A0A402CG51_RHOWR|nr:ABC transporter permease [Rhodococcus wratislaviensis]GCE42534.1 dipeptide transport system permease protein DppB [Rhodococcus wratislaviensis]
MRTAVIRVLTMIPLIALVATGAFFLSQMSNIDPAENIVGANASEQQIDSVRADLGLDQPAVDQYLHWISGAARGDFGSSFYSGTSVAQLMSQALPVTLSLTLGGLLVGIILGVGTGVVAALKAGSAVDRGVILFATAGQAAPSFWLGMLLIYVFAIQLGWLPATGYVSPSISVAGWIESLILPSIALGLAVAAALSRQARSSTIGVLQKDYIRTALSKGLSRRRVVAKHASKNAAAPVVTSLSFQVAHLLGGAIVIERLFAMPGIGTLTIDAVLRYDPNIIQAVVIFSVVIVVVVNLALDLSYTWLNPKVRSV